MVFKECLAATRQTDLLNSLEEIEDDLHTEMKGLLVDWLGFYGTAALYRLYRAGECSECENECAWHAGLVASYHLAPSNSG